MERLDGPEFRLSASRGAVVFINVFASWCPPCNTEQPDLVDFARDHRSDTAVMRQVQDFLSDRERRIVLGLAPSDGSRLGGV
jgi:thiol-disulfide isomerase/thioredoxin